MFGPEPNFLKSLGALFISLCILAAAYFFFVRPYVLSWGTEVDEPAMALPGDGLAPYYSSTRAVTINAPREKVWLWVIQIGGDRGGFFSYDFIEKQVDGHLDYSGPAEPKDLGMEVGRVVPIRPPSPDGRPKEPGEPGAAAQALQLILGDWGVMKDFKVVAVEPGHWFVLEGWGPLALKPLGPGKTRLIIRTHGRELKSIQDRIGYYLFEPLHYIMERKMMLNLKALAERGGGIKLSTTGDLAWALCVFLSFLGLFPLAFWARGFGKILLPTAFGAAWLLVFLVFSPQAVYAAGLLAALIAAAAWLPYRGRRKSQF